MKSSFYLFGIFVFIPYASSQVHFQLTWNPDNDSVFQFSADRL